MKPVDSGEYKSPKSEEKISNLVHDWWPCAWIKKKRIQVQRNMKMERRFCKWGPCYKLRWREFPHAITL